MWQETKLSFLTVLYICSKTESWVILFKDAVGNEFKTSNSAVIASMIDEMKRTLDTIVREIETKSIFKEKEKRKLPFLVVGEKNN